jgi:hypothetical protein
MALAVLFILVSFKVRRGKISRVLVSAQAGSLKHTFTTIRENFRGRRNVDFEWKYSNKGIDSRQGAKRAKFGGEKGIILKKLITLFSDLCGLGVFARDIPTFGCGSSALR